RASRRPVETREGPGHQHGAGAVLTCGSEVELAVLHTGDERPPLARGVGDRRLLRPLAVAHHHPAVSGRRYLDAVVVRREAGFPPLQILVRYCHGRSLRSSRMLAMSLADSPGLIAASRRVFAASW